MTNASSHLDVASAEAYLMRYLSIEGVTGHEKLIGRGDPNLAPAAYRAGAAR